MAARSPPRFFFKDDSTLYGRYWGALEHVPLLHFECCYYQAIEYAIGQRPRRCSKAARRASTSCGAA